MLTLARECGRKGASYPPAPGRRWWWWLLLLALAGLLIVAHGCHGEDIDEELLWRWREWF